MVVLGGFYGFLHLLELYIVGKVTIIKISKMYSLFKFCILTVDTSLSEVHLCIRSPMFTNTVPGTGVAA